MEFRMELRTLRAFVEVVRQGGFTQAAKKVFATQSTVSKAIKQLEDEIGVPLLDRIGHRSQPTAAGEIVYQRALPMLAERDDLIAELEELRGSNAARFGSAFLRSGAARCLPACLPCIAIAIQASISAWSSTAAIDWRNSSRPAKLNSRPRSFRYRRISNGKRSGANR